MVPDAYTASALTMMGQLRIGRKVRCHNGVVDFREYDWPFRLPTHSPRVRAEDEWSVLRRSTTRC